MKIDNMNKCDTELKVHENKINNLKNGTYLDAVLSEDRSLNKNVENRRQKGWYL